MRPCTQGNIDFFCAVYAVINACRYAGRHFIRLGFFDNCEFYQYLMQYLIDKNKLQTVLYNGTEHDLMLELLEHTKKYLKEKHNLNMSFERPYIDTKEEAAEVCRTTGEFVTKNENTACICRVFNLKVLDHWSVIYKKSYKNTLKLLDSYLHPSIDIHKTHWGPYKRNGQNYLAKEGLIYITIEKGA